jgi:hypothetical protein
MHRFDGFGSAATATAAADEADYQAFLGRLGLRDRQTVERHVAACEAEPTPEHARLWRQLACRLASLAAPASDPAPTAPRVGPGSRQFGVQTAGQKALQFFTADGKYRRQLFALEDLRDGVLVVYTVDALAAALRAGALRGPVRTDDDGVPVYELCGCGGHATVGVQALTAANVGEAPNYYRHMVGWNRTALKITLPVAGVEGRLRALNVLYALAARQVAEGH